MKASRFLARAFRADDEAAADTAVAGVRRRFHDASHHCWAFRLGPPERLLERASDDREPKGTAGAPILAALTAADVSDALVVVTRWFGGTKLGTGGLVRSRVEPFCDAIREATSARARVTGRS